MCDILSLVALAKKFKDAGGMESESNPYYEELVNIVDESPDVAGAWNKVNSIVSFDY